MPYPKPEQCMLAVDCVVFGLDQTNLKVVLIQRKVRPGEGRWGLPGGFVRKREALEQAALRQLREQAGINRVFLEQLYTFGNMDRNPMGRVVTVAYYALVNLRDHRIPPAPDGRKAAWFSLSQIDHLGVEHETIIDMAIKRLQGKVSYEPIGFELLPKKFTLSQLQMLYEIVLERKLDKRNFRKKILGMHLLIALDELQEEVAHRAARLYKFDHKKYLQLKRKGFYFEI